MKPKLANFALTLLLTAGALCAQETPSANDFAAWAGYPDAISLTAKPIKTGDFVEWGSPFWITSYDNKSRTLISYVVAVYEPGTLWTRHREELIAAIHKQTGEGKPRNPELQKYLHIDKDPHGREIYFTILGMGPGGGITGGFSFQPKYDLLVMQVSDAEDDMPAEQRLKNPAVPSKELSEVFAKVQAFVESKGLPAHP